MSTYTLNVIDSDSPPAWMDLCKKTTAGHQDSGRCFWTVEVETWDIARFEKALDADESVLSYRCEKL